MACAFVVVSFFVRQLDIPSVDWIIQFDPPDDPKEYIHRVGRTARGDKGTGRALLFLTPEETGFLRYLKAAKVTLNETVSLAKKFGATDSYRYINGVLDQVGISLRPHELSDG